MKQTTKRIISMLLTALMLVSMLSVYTSAANNYVPDEEYYDEIVRDAFIVNPQWTDYSDGAQIEYVFRNELYGSTQSVLNKYTDADELSKHYETFDSNIHFSSFTSAYEFSKENNILNPVIILCPGVYSEKIEIDRDVTILGTNAGINPNVVKNSDTPWSINPEMSSYTSLACLIDLNKYLTADIEVVFDGVKFINGFTYYEAGATQFASNLVVKNSVFDSISAPVVDRTELSSILYFEKATTKAVGITFDNVRIEKLSATLIGNYIQTMNISNTYVANCSAPILNGVDALAGANPEYVIKDSMFYNNVTENGVLYFNHALKDSTTRTKTSLEISGCTFMDGPDNAANPDNNIIPDITFAVAGPKNIVNIHDNKFIAAANNDFAPVNFKYSSNAITNALLDTISFNGNILIGYPTMIDTTGLMKQSKIDYTGNYFADAEGNQVDPIYPSSSSYNNIVLDFYWLDAEKTVPSTIFYVTSIGKEGFTVKNEYKSIYVELDKNEKFPLDLKTADSSTKYTVYSDSDFKNTVTDLDASNLYIGENKNVFYAVGVSSKIPGYKFVYNLYVSTYNPDYAPEFNEPNTYMYTPDVKGLANGTIVSKDWNGTSYKFVVGKTIFSTTKEIFDIATIPTILIPAGTYEEDFCISESCIVLGAKHGINPNIPDYETFEKGWLANPERTDLASETVFENCAIYIATPSINVTAEIDGITLGEGSSFYDIGDKVQTHTTTTIRNVVINNAGGAELKEVDVNGAPVTRTSSNVFTFGGVNGNDFNDNHKDVRLVNIRMENQSNYYLIGTYIESIYIDGLYFAGSSKRLHYSELTSPKTQNFTLEVRNSCFYECTPTTGVIVVTNKETDTPERQFNKIIYDNNIFYQPSTYLYGVIGVRFYSKRDSFTFTNNIVMSTYAQHSLMPGSTGWFTGPSACENLTVEQQANADTIKDVTIKFNRICGPYKPVDKLNVKFDTCWDYSYNYICDLDYADSANGNFPGGVFKRTTAGIQVPKYSDAQKNYSKCDYYFTDWDMTNLNTTPDSFKNELEYEIRPTTPNAKIDNTAKTYIDTVSSDTNTYTFDINLKTTQASYAIFSDADFQNKVSDTVVLDKISNEFYIRFTSFKNAVVHTYKVTINKKIVNDAKIISIDNFSVTNDTVTAIVPLGTESVILKKIKLSEGATYKIYNDAAKTKRFYVTKIDGITTEPLYKYIEVTSADGKIVNDYVFTIKQGVSDLADITEIQNAEKTGDTAFTAYIPVADSSFVLIPSVSEGATLTVTNDGLDHTVQAGKPYLIHNIGSSKTLKMTVTAQSGNKKTFTLTINKDPKNVELSYIYNMYSHGSDNSEFFTTVNTSTFDLKPVFKNNLTTYKLYKDKDCTKEYTDKTIYLTTKTTVLYLKATSLDKTTQKILKLSIVTTDPNAKPDPKPDTPSGDGNNNTQIEDITTKFKDVVKGSWYEEFVKFAYNNGIFDGTSETTFSPQSNITRAQFVRILANIEGTATDNTVNSSFTDVPSNKWYTGAVEWAYKAGIVSGVGNNKFDPEKAITRQEMAVMTVNYVEKYLKTTLPSVEEQVNFADDSDISSWAKAEVYKCQKAGLLSGVGDNKFAPSKTATRAEGATLFTEFYNIIKTAK